MTITLPYNIVRYLPLAALTGTALLIAFNVAAQTYISDAQAAKYAGDSYIDGRGSIARQMSQKLGIYAGVDYSRSMVSYDQVSFPFKENLNGGNIYLGLPLMEKLDLEIGYNQTERGTDTYAGGLGETEVQLRGVTADLVGNLPINSDNTVQLLGAVGVGGYRLDVSRGLKNGVMLEGQDDDVAVRFGLGAQVQLTDTLGVRGMVRYVNVNFEDDVLDNIITTDVGLNLTF